MLEEYQQKLTEEQTFAEKWRRVSAGLKMPRDSGEYKYALFAMQRLFGPGSVSTAVCVLILLLLLVFVRFSGDSEPPELEVGIVEPEIEELEEIIEEPEEVVDTEMVSLEPTQDTVAEADVSDPAASFGDDSSEEMVTVATVDFVKSPMVLRGLLGGHGAGRSSAGRAGAIGKYGGGMSDTAVLKALRWLKDHQLSNGSWSDSGSTTAMTGLALLCYMAHGETPASVEFGKTVETAIRYLLEQQNSDGKFKNAGSHYSYGHAIATYALAESYGMTKIIMLKQPMEMGAKIIVDGQQPGGAWDYDYKKGERKDMSVVSWQVQALKACKLSGASVEGLEEAIEKSLVGIASFGTGSGYLSYGGSGRSSTLTAAGVLCYQLLGKVSSQVVLQGMDVIKTMDCSWPKSSHNDAYSWYYATQATFQQGGPAWENWNKRVLPMLVKNQMDDGHWEGAGSHGSSPTFDTTLCCLCLEVYYRYLPTYARVEEVQRAPRTKDEADIQIRVDLTL
jgi:hypothetical protein